MFKDIYTITADTANEQSKSSKDVLELLKRSTYAQEKVDDVIVEILDNIHEAIYRFKQEVVVKHDVFARIIEEPIEILVRRAEVICNLRELGFKCITSDKDVEDGTLTISWKK